MLLMCLLQGLPVWSCSHLPSRALLLLVPLPRSPAAGLLRMPAPHGEQKDSCLATRLLPLLLSPPRPTTCPQPTHKDSSLGTK